MAKNGKIGIDGGLLVSLGDGIAPKAFERALAQVEASFADDELDPHEKRTITMKFTFAQDDNGLIGVALATQARVPCAKDATAIATMDGDTMRPVDLPKAVAVKVAAPAPAAPLEDVIGSAKHPDDADNMGDGYGTLPKPVKAAAVN